MEERLESAIVSAILLNELGFQTNDKSNLQNLLKQTKCEGRTALRDAIVTGIQMMLSLGELLRKLGTFENYNFVHVVLTDGADNGSRASILDLQKLFLIVTNIEFIQLLQIGTVIPVKVLTTHFIGVDMSAADAQELKQITTLGLENAQLHQSTDAGLDRIFAKIIASIKEQRQIRMQAMSLGNMQALRIQQQTNPYLELSIKKYVVLFTLDKSGSMEGGSWNKVCQCVGNFMNILGNYDLVAGITFNDKVNIITKNIKQRSYSQPKPQPKAIQQQPQQQLKKKKKKCIIF